MKHNTIARLLVGAMASVAAMSLMAETWTDPDTGITWSYYYTFSNRPVLEIANYDFYGNVSVAVTPLPRRALAIPSKINGDYVESIGAYAFEGCEDLTSVTIPDRVFYVDPSAFSGCGLLKSVVFEGTNVITIADIADEFPSSCRFFVSRESTGWGVTIPGTWNEHEIRYVEDFLPPQSPDGLLRPGIWYGTDVAACHVADYSDVMQRADAENRPFVAVFGNKDCSYCSRYLQRAIDPTTVVPANAFLYNAYFSHSDDLASDPNYQATHKIVADMPWGATLPLIYLRWQKSDGTLLERVRYYGEEVNGNRTYPKTVEDLMTYVDEMSDGVSCYVQFYHNDKEHSTLTLRIVKPDSEIGELPVLVRDGYDFEGWYTSNEGGRRVTSTYLVQNDMMLYAHWRVRGAVMRMDSDWLEVSGENYASAVGKSVNGPLGDYFQVSSGSAATVKLSGLPSGVKFNANTQTISGAPTMRGVYYVTCSAKNKNGYSHSFTSVWNVGGASNGDYDNIGLDYRIDVDAWENLATGVAIDEFCTNMKQVSGLPTGLKFIAGSKCGPEGWCTACSGFVEGTPTKAGVFKVTFMDYDGAKAAKTIVVKDSGCRYLNVVSPNPRRGTVTGSKVYAIGAKASISAKAASGNYFAGWYLDAEFNEPLYGTASGDWRKASDSVVLTEEIAETGIFAKFVSSYEDNLYIDCGDTWNVETGWDDCFDVNVSSETLPTVTVKGLPSGVTWNKSYFALESTSSKLKPGTTVATITAKNLSGRTTTKTVRIVVPNLQSRVFDGLDYSSDAYNLMVGISDACVSGWLSFDYDTSYSVSASGLPPGLRLDMDSWFGGGTACVLGTPTKVGVYTVTLTAKRGSYAEKATFTINVVPLPEYAVGTFNGVLKDETSGEIVGSFTFTAAATGKQSVKVVTKLGTMSLSASAWNCYDDADRPMADFYKYSKDERFWFVLTPTATAWNCNDQLEGTLWWSKRSSNGESSIEAVVGEAQRNPFTKTGNYYDHSSAVKVAESLASEYKTEKMVILWDSDRQAYRLECANCVAPGYDYGTATLKMNKNGTATISGKLYNLYSFSATSTLTFDTECGGWDSYLYGEHCYAVFTPVVKTKACIASGFSANCHTENEFIPIFWNPLD